MILEYLVPIPSQQRSKCSNRSFNAYKVGEWAEMSHIPARYQRIYTLILDRYEHMQAHMYVFVCVFTCIQYNLLIWCTAAHLNEFNWRFVIERLCMCVCLFVEATALSAFLFFSDFRAIIINTFCENNYEILHSIIHFVIISSNCLFAHKNAAKQLFLRRNIKIIVLIK